nr:MAG TPA: hypothetical protein [Caudoviricetes sp.]
MPPRQAARIDKIRSAWYDGRALRGGRCHIR